MASEDSARQMIEQAFDEATSERTLRTIMASPTYQQLSRKVGLAVNGHDFREVLAVMAAVLTSMTPYERDHEGAVPIVQRAVEVTNGMIRDDGMRAPELMLVMAAILSGLAVYAPNKPGTADPPAS